MLLRGSIILREGRAPPGPPVPPAPLPRSATTGTFAAPIICRVRGACVSSRRSSHSVHELHCQRGKAYTDKTVSDALRVVPKARVAPKAVRIATKLHPFQTLGPHGYRKISILAVVINPNLSCWYHDKLTIHVHIRTQPSGFNGGISLPF